MSIGDLIKNLVILGLLGVGGYTVYQHFSVDPITRTDEQQDQGLDEDADSDTSIDDCERYVNADNRQACIEARTQ